MSNELITSSKGNTYKKVNASRDITSSRYGESCGVCEVEEDECEELAFKCGSGHHLEKVFQETPTCETSLNKRIPICPVCGENVETIIKKKLKTAEYAQHHIEVITELLVICYTCGTVFENFKSGE